MKYDNHIIGPAAPRMGNALTRAVGSGLLKLFGWKVEGKLPNEAKVILVGEPHTSNWDFVLIMCAAQSIGFRMSYIEQVKLHVKANDNIFLAITPSGSRSPKEKYKTGYLRMAHAFDMPIFLIGVDGSRKSIVLDRLVDPLGDIATQNKSIQDYMDATYVGIKPSNQRLGPIPEAPPDILIGARKA